MYNNTAISRWKIPERFLKDSDSASVLLGVRRRQNKLGNKSINSLFQDDNRETLYRKSLLSGLQTVSRQDPGKIVSVVNAEVEWREGKKWTLENRKQSAEDECSRKENIKECYLEPKEKSRLEKDVKEWSSKQSKFQKGFPDILHSSSNSDSGLLLKYQSAEKMKEEKTELPISETGKHGKEVGMLSERSKMGQILQLPPLPLKSEGKPVQTARHFHLRLLTPTTRANKILFQTWHGRPTYHDYYTSYIGSFFFNSHRSLPREYVIHPDWG
ncbi:uncharacterized protein LOC122812213 isoform X2 [Protopterus annectens]|uniref:uncharacterized protein LOC122812213 isoform X2 n=1 Tax=Protopterus annectens TaxID=7888 RepID=UPI001CFB1B29|nr:uncharacterized protein LOC122812213 isoform X2 [Protopterus annectens]